MLPVTLPSSMSAPTTTRPPHKPWYAQLYPQVLAAILLGVLLAHFYRQTGEAMKPIGYAFIKLVKMIKMIIAPVFFSPS